MITMFIISLSGWIIIYIVYKMFEPDTHCTLIPKLWQVILIFLSTFIPVFNVAIMVALGAVFSVILYDYYHIKPKIKESKVFKILNKNI